MFILYNEIRYRGFLLNTNMQTPISKERYILKKIIKSIYHIIEDNTLKNKDNTNFYRLLKRCEYIEDAYFKLDDEVYRLEHELERSNYDKQ